MPLSQNQLQILHSVCDTIIPELEGNPFWQRKASDLEVPSLIHQLLDTFSAKEQKQLSQFLALFGMPVVGLLTTGKLAAFVNLPSAKREKWLLAFANSRFLPLRQGFQAIKKLTTFIYYGHSQNNPNPNWAEIGYPGPLSTPPKKAKSFMPIWLDKGKDIAAEVLVIGSGAGGGVVAAELAAAGKEVLLVEKGGYFNEADFSQKEAEMVSKLYERGGNLVSENGGITIFAGSCLGGGTTVNWAGTFRTPDYVLHEWATEHQLPHLLQPAFQEAMDAASLQVMTNTEVVHHNPQNQKLWDGSTLLGQKVGLVPQNIPASQKINFKGLGYAGLGDQYGHKQSSLINHLEKAKQHGARFMVQTHCNRLLLQNGSVVGVEVTQTLPSGENVKKVIKAEKVVLSAGAIHTPIILQNSGVVHPHIGQHLYLHPTISVSAMYQEAIDPWHGIMMSAVNDHFTRLSGNHGFKLETPPAHPGLIGLSIPWLSGRHHKEMMQQASHLASFIILVRDKNGGSVKADRYGNPNITYWPGKLELEIMQKGIVEASRIHFAAGAEKVFVPHNFLSSGFLPHEQEKISESIKKLLWKPNYFTLFSAHQMGTCRMGGNSATHPVTPEGQVFGIKNLYVADASLFPASSGANPMLSILALAHYVAQSIKS